jgi:type IV pilus assembly protein PilP
MNRVCQNKINGLRSIWMAALLLGILSGWVGCKPSPELPQQPAVVRKKIPASPILAAKPPPAIAGKKETGPKALKPASEPATVPEKDTGDKKAGQKEAVKPLAATKSEPVTQSTGEDPFPALYSSEGRADPFVPFIKSKAEREKEREKNKKKRIPRTPLEKVDISLMKLTAIVQSPTGNFGMIEEPTGKGYVVTVGTFIGINGGRIKRIFNDHLTVEEEAEDALGKITTREVAVKLHKPAGEF